MRKLTTCAMLSMTLALTACETPTSNSATSAAICNSWGEGLFLPSRADTLETARASNRQIKDHRAACTLIEGARPTPF